MNRFLLELSEAERASTMRALSQYKKSGRANEVAHLIADLKELQAHQGIIIETSEDVTPEQFHVYTSLQMPIDVILVRNVGNDRETAVLEQSRDPERIAAVVASIRINKALRPLLEVLDDLRDTIALACESSAPDTQSIRGLLHDFERQLRAAVADVDAI